jgi:hypothetical protein
MKERFLGIIETTWSNPQNFIDGYYGLIPANAGIAPANAEKHNAVDCFKDVFQRIDALGQ